MTKSIAITLALVSCAAAIMNLTLASAAVIPFTSFLSLLLAFLFGPLAGFAIIPLLHLAYTVWFAKRDAKPHTVFRVLLTTMLIALASWQIVRAWSNGWPYSLELYGSSVVFTFAALSILCQAALAISALLIAMKPNPTRIAFGNGMLFLSLNAGLLPYLGELP